MKINKKIKKVAFVGMGLINSSLARDLKIKKFYLSSSAYSRRLSTINKIKKLKLVDFASSNVEKTIQEADIIIVGIPVAAYKEVFKKICNHIKPGAIITDVGSVKKEVINSVKNIYQKMLILCLGILLQVQKILVQSLVLQAYLKMDGVY